MPRKTRKQLLLDDEDLARRDREEGYRRLKAQLCQEWRNKPDEPDYPRDAE